MHLIKIKICVTISKSNDILAHIIIETSTIAFVSVCIS